MLQNIRENAQGMIAKTIIVLLILSLSVWGLDSIFSGGRETSVATVNGEEITEREFETAVRIQRRRQLQEMETPDASRIDTDQLNEDTMETLIQEKLVSLDIRDRGLELTDQDVDRMITSMEQFQVDGQFSQERFTRTVRNQGMTVERFREAVAENHMRRLLQFVLRRSAFSPSVEARRVARVLRQSRDFTVLEVPLAQVMAELSVSEDELKRFYEQNRGIYRLEESADVAWITLDRSDLVNPSAIDEESVRQRYRQRIETMGLGEKRNPAHILISDSSQNARKTIKNVRKALDEGRNFAELARQYSDDSASAENGGELGLSSREDFADAFSKALFSIEAEGDIAGPVETSFGTHFIKLLEVKKEDPPAFSEMETELRRELARERARERFVELSEELADTAYSEDDLQASSELIDAEIQTREGVTPESGEPPFDHPKLRQRLFSDDVVQEGFNTELVEVSDGRAVVARVRDYSPARQREFAAVRGQIRERLLESRAREKLREQLSDGAAGPGREQTKLEALASKFGVDLQQYQDVSRNDLTAPAIVRDAAFSMPKPDNSRVSTKVVELPESMALVRLNNVVEPDQANTAMMASNVQSQLARAHGQSVYYYYLQQLRSEAEINRD